MNNESAAKRVQRGIDYLNTVDPTSAPWATQINLDYLDIGDECNCVLGQLFGTYEAGKDALAIEFVQAHTHGFLPLDDDAGTVEDDNRALTAEWKRRIEALA